MVRNKDMLDQAFECFGEAVELEDPLERIAGCIAAMTACIYVATNILNEETKIGGAFHALTIAARKQT